MNEEHTPTSPKFYWKIALVLAALTAFEVALFYIDRELGLGLLNRLVLILFSSLKFVIVVGWFMHLRYEKPLLNRFFTAGFVLAVSLYAIVLGALGVFAFRGGGL